MRVAFFGQSGPYAPAALRRLLPATQSFQVVVVVEGRRRPLGRLDHRWLQPRRSGDVPSPAVASPAVASPAVASPAVASPAVASGDPEDLSGLALSCGVPVLQTADVNAARVIDRLDALQIDWLVCVGFDRLFSPALLRTAAAGRINAHPSALPDLRGPSPLFWLLRRGARAAAVSLHEIDRFEDHGVIYDQRPFLFPAFATGAELFRVAGALAGEMLVDALARAARRQLRGVPQQHAAATRAPRPRAEDARVVPAEWEAEALVHFACGAPYFRPAWMRLGDDTFFMRRGCEARVGRRLPAEYVLRNSDLFLQARDGVAHVEIQR